jgi:hypothetical protein
MSLSMLSHGLARRFQLLTNGARTALPRHQTLSALIDWSYDLLSAVERRTLPLALSRGFPPGYHFEGVTLLCLAIAEFYANDLVLARRYAAQSAEIFKQTELYPTYTCWAISLEAMFTSLGGDFHGALTLAQDALSRFGGGDQYFLIDLVQVVAAMLAQSGRRRESALLIGGCDAAAEGRFGKPPSYAQALFDRTIAQLRDCTPATDLEAWLAEGRSRSYEQLVAAALDIDRRPRTSVSTLYG